MKKRSRYLVFGTIVLTVIILAWPFNKKEIPIETKAKSLDVRIFFGYKDARPARFVGDRYEMAMFLQKLTGPCTADRQDCEFKPAIDSSEGSQAQVFYKWIKRPEGAAPLRVQLRVFTSSVGSDDDENRSNPFQKWKSEYLKDQFTKALKTADVVFYNGHSRAGGGPDFAVPEMTKLKHVHYAHYQKVKPGLSLIQNSLKQSPNSPLQVLGLYSCQSDQLFRKKVEAVKSSVKVLGSRQLLYFSDAFNDSLDQLSQIIKTI